MCACARGIPRASTPSATQLVKWPSAVRIFPTARSLVGLWLDFGDAKFGVRSSATATAQQCRSKGCGDMERNGGTTNLVTCIAGFAPSSHGETPNHSCKATAWSASLTHALTRCFGPMILDVTHVTRRMDVRSLGTSRHGDVSARREIAPIELMVFVAVMS